MRFIPLFLTFCLAVAQTPSEHPTHAAQLQGVRNVYFLPMPNGLDQFVANQLASSGILGVVADPRMADAVFTDTVGKGFQQKLNEIYPAPKPAAPGEDEKDEKGKVAGTEVKAAEDSGVRAGGLSRGKGTIFLVDRRTSQVLWSAYVRPASSSPKDLDRAAKKITKAIERSFGRTQKSSH